MPASLSTGGPMRVKTTSCRSCGARIWWAKTERNRPTPMNLAPAPDGVYIVATADPPRVVMFNEFDPAHAGRSRFHTHFVDCPQSKSWRKTRSTR